jgi:phospholipid/cholesterol/gamma-HCH transport system permease protein
MAVTTVPVVAPFARAGVKAGRGLATMFATVGDWMLFSARVVTRSVTDIVVRLKYRTVVLRHVSDICAGSGAFLVGGGMVFVVFAMSFFTGATVGLQGYQGLARIGAESFTGLVGSFANVREVTPLIAATALAAQTGASFTAEIGAMRISDEIDALDVMAVPSLVYLVCTRLVATVIALIPLYLISLFASFFATRLITTKLFGLSTGVYDHYFRLYLPIEDIVFSVIKVVVFAVNIVLIHCWYGYNASGGPAGVGVAVGRAIRMSIVTTVVINLVLSLLFWGDGGAASLTG